MLSEVSRTANHACLRRVARQRVDEFVASLGDLNQRRIRRNSPKIGCRPYKAKKGNRPVDKCSVLFRAD
eukprot:3235654-Pleurochrysis_carterae.AAC.1